MNRMICANVDGRSRCPKNRVFGRRAELHHREAKFKLAAGEATDCLSILTTTLRVDLLLDFHMIRRLALENLHFFTLRKEGWP
jgi:hypothetical protein